MIKHLKYKNINWIEVTSPTKEEISNLASAYDIHPVIAHELEARSERSKVDLYDNCLYLILHFPTFAALNQNETVTKDSKEIDIIVGQDFVITTHYESIGSIEEFAKILETTTVLDKSKKDIHAGYLFFYILRHIYQSLEPGLNYLNSELKKIEERTFSGQEKENVESLSRVNRTLLDFRWTLKNHKSVLASLTAAGHDFFGPKFSYYLEAIVGEHEKVWSMLESSREYFLDLQTTNDSLLSIKSNEIMKFLTIMAFTTFPLSLLAAIFGMNVGPIPFEHHPYGFIIVIGIMLTATFIMFIFFRHKKWL